MNAAARQIAVRNGVSTFVRVAAKRGMLYDCTAIPPLSKFIVNIADMNDPVLQVLCFREGMHFALEFRTLCRKQANAIPNNEIRQ